MSRLFDGIDDNISISGYKGILGSSNRTVCLWMKTSSTSDEVFVAWGADSNANQVAWRFRIDGVNGKTLRSECNGGFIRGSTAVNDGNWHFVAQVLNGTDVTNTSHYLDTVLETIGGSTAQGVNTSSGIDTLIGCKVDGSGTGTKSTFFSGEMAYIQIFNRALSLNELKQLYRFPGSILNGCQLFIPMWGGSPEGDYSGNLKNGTVTGAIVSSDNPPINGIFKKKRSSLYYASMFPVSSGTSAPIVSQAVNFRRTLSGLGARTGSRQVHAWGNN